MKKRFWATTFTLTGSIIGAGVLGLPYIIAQAGFFLGVMWIILLGAVLMYVHLALAEVTLRTKGVHQLSGYAEKYLGSKGKRLMFFTMIFGIYAALIAYLVGEGQSFSILFGGIVSPLIFGVVFWLVMTLLLHGGLNRLKKVETYGVFAIMIIILGMFIFYLPSISLSNLSTLSVEFAALPFGIVLFALMGFTSIPELRQEIKGQEKLFKKAVILGSFIPIVLYILFAAVVVGVLGSDTPQVATLSFGPVVILLGIFTMMTSFFLLSFALRDMFLYDLKYSKKKTSFFVSLLPLVLYLLIEFTQVISFSSILNIGGVVSGGLTGILAVWMNYQSKHKQKKRPELVVPMNKLLAVIISIIFLAGMILLFVY